MKLCETSLPCLIASAKSLKRQLSFPERYTMISLHKKLVNCTTQHHTLVFDFLGFFFACLLIVLKFPN